MMKQIMISVVVIMWAVATAQAFDPSGWFAEGFNIQSQDASAQLEGLIDFDQSEQQATNHQWLTVFNTHDLENAHNIDAWQHQKVLLSTADNAEGNSADLIIGEGIDALGSQLQLVKGGVGEKAQWQIQGLDSLQALVKSNGEADASGSNTTFLNESQSAENAAGSIFEGSSIIAGQLLGNTAGPTAVGEVQQQLSVDVEQLQQVVN